jgi:hypothetical protein
MQNREELSKEGTIGVKTIMCRRRGKEYHFPKRGGIKNLTLSRQRNLFCLILLKF